jgi:hypothetical protein
MRPLYHGLAFENANRKVASNMPPPERNSLSLAASETPTMALLRVWPNTHKEHVCAFEVSQEFGKYPVNGRHFMNLRSRAGVASGRPAAVICRKLVSNSDNDILVARKKRNVCIAPDSSSLLGSNFRNVNDMNSHSTLHVTADLQ